eukprot:COSAG01_NODE_81620_length_110_cov_12.090909_1_plen_36_part_11
MSVDRISVSHIVGESTFRNVIGHPTIQSAISEIRVS